MFARDEKTAARDEQTTLLGSPLSGGGMAQPSLGAAGHQDWHLDAVLRQGFIRKVYGILTAQLVLTFGMIFLFVFVEPVKLSLCGMSSRQACDSCAYYVQDLGHVKDPQPGWYYSKGKSSPEFACMYEGKAEHVDGLCNLSPAGGCFRPTPALLSTLTTAMMLSFVFILAIVCGGDTCSRKYPTNYIALFSFTACEGVTIGITCLFQDAVSVGMAAAMTALVTAGLTYYAFHTKVDFTGMGAYLYAALLTLLVTSFVGSFFSIYYSTPILQTLYAGGGCLVFSCYIVYDTQLIVGGRHAKHKFGVDDYVFAALNIYLDIINLFLYILQMLNQRER